MSGLVTDELLDGLGDAAIQAGLLAKRMRKDGTGVRAKPDGSPVTDADQAAEQLILRALAKLAPGIPVVAEESGQTALDADPEVPFFLVDPLDGTREYVQGRRDYTVNIALVQAGEPSMGVVGVPELDLLFIGARGQAFCAQLTDDGREIKRTALRARLPGAKLLALVSGSHLDADTERFLKDRDITDTRAYGSSLKLCRLATGEGDLYPRFGRTMQWDTAAADAVLRYAGGATCRLDGAPLIYGPHKSAPNDVHPFANCSFVAFGHWTDEQRRNLLQTSSCKSLHREEMR